ncbi:MAG: NAD(P)/FAD-dependent oxidoreductase [Phycisphaerae bacterium]|nr:NAD(P)/FAD-dependent oxidoreductase [Phycisphaerae bacterium]
MPHSANPRIAIVGSGLCGALLAVYVGRAGYPVDLYERRPDPRSGKVVGGRSINLALSTRGLTALERVGLADEIMKIAVPMRGRMIHPQHGDLAYQPYDKDPSKAINSVSRAALNLLLIEAAAKLPNVRMHFDWRCVDADLDAPAVMLEHAETGESRRAEADIIIGADGAFSAIRGRMQKVDRFDYSQEYLAHGYKELHIPPKDGGGFRMEPNALHIWPRRSFMMIALPNPEGSFTCTCFWPWTGPNGFDRLRTPAEVEAYFREIFPDAVPLMPTLVEDYQRNPTSSLLTVRCGPWHYRDKVLILGDAAHAIVPFYGQGMNCAFEDCNVFGQILDAARAQAPRSASAPTRAPEPRFAGEPGAIDWESLFARFYEARKRNADTVADLALHNFIEMRDHSGSRLFQLHKAWERTLHRWLPNWYTPLYTLVSFSNTPYADAVARAKEQTRIVNRVLAWAGAAVVAGLSLAAWLLLR